MTQTAAPAPALGTGTGAAGGRVRNPVTWRIGALVLSAVGVADWAVSVGRLHPYRAGAIGLVTHLPVVWWVGLVLVAAGVVLGLAEDRPRAPVAVLTLVALAVVLHGTLPAAEHDPRFEAAYTVAGFTEYIARTGHTLPRLDARMSWFGMLSGAAMAMRAMQVTQLWFLRWAPLVFELAYLFPLKALANVALRTPRARYAALAVFLAGNWIDQDYFSPQAVGLLLFLVVLAVAVRTFGARGLQPKPLQWLMARPAVRRLRTAVLRLAYVPLDATAAEAEPEPTGAGTRAVLVVLVLALVTVTVISHELSPVALCIVLFFLALAGRTRLRTLWLFTALLVFAWLSWAAEPFWSGHLGKIFGGVGSLGSTFSSSVTGRAVSQLFGRSVVEAARLSGAGLDWLAAGLGTYVLWRRGRTLWSIVILAVTPVAVGGAVSYGGEVALRILLFSLAPLSILAVLLIDGPRVRRWEVGAFGLFCCALLVVFPVARFGNESFEAVAPGDLAATNWIYAHVPTGSTIEVFSRDEPLLYDHAGAYKTRELGLTVTGSVASIEAVLPRGQSWIFLTRTQYEYAYVYGGLPKDWLTVFEGKLGQISFVREVERTATARVYLVESRRHHRVHVVPSGAHAPRPTGHAPVPRPPTPTVPHQPRPPTVTHPKPTTPGKHHRPPVGTTTPPSGTSSTGTGSKRHRPVSGSPTTSTGASSGASSGVASAAPTQGVTP